MVRFKPAHSIADRSREREASARPRQSAAYTSDLRSVQGTRRSSIRAASWNIENSAHRAGDDFGTVRQLCRKCFVGSAILNALYECLVQRARRVSRCCSHGDLFPDSRGRGLALITDRTAVSAPYSNSFRHDCLQYQFRCLGLNRRIGRARYIEGRSWRVPGSQRQRMRFLCCEYCT